ncbi:hypothetical protein JY96_18410 [Aquabacterium sp. NJ1]|uniref:hypothetical protein n=1 Tax=Aquabacterium sp. NJ1 TaxID=1538295 RepID=UPI00052DF026|nr:hypothetical protein [Aquabacterium sp. NJ1]KGM41372.1 hypothetical protein JY96_18410 [Aquabacterium sp. NJ1]
MSDLSRWILALISTPVLAGCCTAMTDQSEGYAQGWRPARVEAVVDAQATVRFAYRDCRQADPASDASGPYVLASYSFGGNPNLRHTMVVRMPAGQAPEPGQHIQINIVRCEMARPAAPATY